MKCTSVATIVVLIVVSCQATAAADAIDFSSLDVNALTDPAGQDFDWQFEGESGIVNVQADWSNVFQIDGALRTATQSPASFADPFHGTVHFKFDAPVQLRLLATFASLTRDGLDGGRFEQIRFNSNGNATFSGDPETSAIYSGEGSESILVDDLLTPTPVLSDWGVIGDGKDDTYRLEYTSTRVGLSETFDVIVVPEPSGFSLCLAAPLVFAILSRRKSKSTLATPRRRDMLSSAS